MSFKITQREFKDSDMVDSIKEKMDYLRRKRNMNSGDILTHRDDDKYLKKKTKNPNRKLMYEFMKRSIEGNGDIIGHQDDKKHIKEVSKGSVQEKYLRMRRRKYKNSGDIIGHTDDKEKTTKQRSLIRLKGKNVLRDNGDILQFRDSPDLSKQKKYGKSQKSNQKDVKKELLLKSLSNNGDIIGHTDDDKHDYKWKYCRKHVAKPVIKEERTGKRIKGFALKSSLIGAKVRDGSKGNVLKVGKKHIKPRF